MSDVREAATHRPPSLRDRWPTLVGIVAAAAFLLTGAWKGFVGAAVCYVLFGIFRRTRRSGPWLAATGIALIAFGILNVLALTSAEPALRYLAAAGWLAHGVWDVLHHRADRVVPRWWAELCFVADLLLAAALLLLPQVTHWHHWLWG